jgi:zinc transporter ZupT
MNAMNEIITMDVDEFKLITSLLILLLGLLGGLLPMKLINQNDRMNMKIQQQQEQLLPSSSSSEPSYSSSSSACFLNMFTAGIFFSSAVLHFLPDAIQNKQLSNFTIFAQNKKNLDGDVNDDDSDNYPWANLFFAIGFIFLLSIESLAHQLQGMYACYQDLKFNNTNNQDICLDHGKDDIDEADDANDSDSDLSFASDINKNTYKADTTISSSYGSCDAECGGCVHSTSPEYLMHEHQPYQQHDSGVNIKSLPPSPTNDIMSFVIFTSLSTHSILAGIGIGSQPDCAWDVFFAILVHKSLAAFSLGVELSNRMLGRRVYLSFIISFAFMTPLGVLLGWGLSAIFSGEDSAFSGICMALSGGTFLYISVMEVIPLELKNRTNVGLKMFGLTLGFVIVAILAVYV